MKRLMQLIEKERITLEEIEEMEGVETEYIGASGHKGYHWYSVKTEDEEYKVYVNVK